MTAALPTHYLARTVMQLWIMHMMRHAGRAFLWAGVGCNDRFLNCCADPPPIADFDLVDDEPSVTHL